MSQAGTGYSRGATTARFEVAKFGYESAPAANDRGSAGAAGGHHDPRKQSLGPTAKCMGLCDRMLACFAEDF